METLLKKIDCKSLENYQGNFHDEVSFSKVMSLQFSDSNFAINRIHHRFFLENLPKTSCLKKIKKAFFWEKGLQRFNKAAALYYTTLNFIKKADLMQDLSVEALKVLIYSQVNILGGGFFPEVAGLEFIPAISLNRTPSQVLRGSSF